MRLVEHKSYFFALHLNYEECMAYYKGHYSQVQVVSDCGRTIRFDANKLRSFISSIGIKGRFRLILALDNKFISLEKVN